MLSFKNVDQYNTSAELPWSIRILYTLQLAMVAVTTTESSYLGSFIEKFASEKVIEGRDRGGRCLTELTLLKYLFLGELNETPPAKPPTMVLTVSLITLALNRICTMLTDPAAILGSCWAIPPAASALGSLVLFSYRPTLPRPLAS